MNYRWLYAIFLICFIFLIDPSSASSSEKEVHDLNLNTYLAQQNKASLEGDWRYIEGIRTPNEMEQAYMVLPTTKIPIEFSRLFNRDDASATFSTYIKIPSRFVGQLMAIDIPYEYSAYRLFIGNQEIAKKGKVATDLRYHESQIVPAIGYFTPQSTTIFVTMQVSNDGLIRGGFVENLSLGTAKAISTGITTKVFIHTLLIGCILIVGIFMIFIGAYRVYTRSLYIFGVFCISIALRALFGVPFIYAILWPNFDWLWAIKAEYALTCLSTFFFVWLVYNISNKLFNPLIFYMTQSIVVIVLICVLFLSPVIFQKTFFYAFLIAIPLFAYMGWILIQSTRMKNDLAMNNLIGIVLVCLAVLIDFFNGLGVLHLPPLSFAATAFYVIIQMFFLSKQFSVEVTGRLQLNEQLQQLNHLLDEKIYERTKELEEANERLRELANRDGLTQVYNRHYFNEYMKKTFAEVIKEHASLSMLILDVDDFKKYNDFYGHIEGDQLLQYLASEMSKVVPKEGVLARYGGEEFAIVLPNCSNEQATAIAEKIKWHIQHQNLQHAASDYGFITVSIGVATHECKTRYATVNELINAADQNLYIGKNTGKNKVVY